MRRLALPALCVLHLAACGIFESEERRVIGIVYPPVYGTQTGSPFLVPTVAEVGVGFSVTVLTGGVAG